MKQETESLLELTDKSYDEYNSILPVIKQRLGSKAEVFNKVLAEELPLTTARRAYRTAIMVAAGEPKVYREPQHQSPQGVKVATAK
jgi:hypothetical protein